MTLDDEPVVFVCRGSRWIAQQSMTTREFYVLYDYGQGGLWAILRAESAEQVRQRFPQLQVFEEPPAVLELEVLEKIRQSGIFRIDDLAAGWLPGLAERNHRGAET